MIRFKVFLSSSQVMSHKIISEDLLSVPCHFHHWDVLMCIRWLIVVVDRDVERVLYHIYRCRIVACVTLWSLVASTTSLSRLLWFLLACYVSCVRYMHAHRIGRLMNTNPVPHPWLRILMLLDLSVPFISRCDITLSIQVYLCQIISWEWQLVLLLLPSKVLGLIHEILKLILLMMLLLLELELFLPQNMLFWAILGPIS